MSVDEIRIFHKDVFERIDEEKQIRILNAAAEEFADKGFSAANINIIAENAGVSVGSLYKYFESKKHLYLEVVNRGFTLIDKALGPILSSDLSLVGKISGIVDAVFEATRIYPLMNRLYCRFTSESNSELARSLAGRLETITADAYSSLLSQAREENLIESFCDEKMSAFFMDNLFLTLQFSLSSEYWKDRMEIYLGKEKASDEAFLKEQMVAFLRRALGIIG